MVQGGLPTVLSGTRPWLNTHGAGFTDTQNARVVELCDLQALNEETLPYFMYM